jgi:hypothetical protein
MSEPYLATTQNTHAIDFRFVYCNAFAMQFSGADLCVRFGVAHDAADHNKGMQEQVAVFMTPPAMKTLYISLKSIIEHVEKISGVEIQVSPATAEILKKMIKESEEKQKST